jgi:hypothetical protein
MGQIFENIFGTFLPHAHRLIPDRLNGVSEIWAYPINFQFNLDIST